MHALVITYHNPRSVSRAFECKVFSAFPHSSSIVLVHLILKVLTVTRMRISHVFSVFRYSSLLLLDVEI